MHESLNLPWDTQNHSRRYGLTILPRKPTGALVCEGEGWTSYVLGPVTRASCYGIESKAYSEKQANGLTNTLRCKEVRNSICPVAQGSRLSLGMSQWEDEMLKFSDGPGPITLPRCGRFQSTSGHTHLSCWPAGQQTKCPHSPAFRHAGLEGESGAHKLMTEA